MIQYQKVPIFYYWNFDRITWGFVRDEIFTNANYQYFKYENYKKDSILIIELNKIIIPSE